MSILDPKGPTTIAPITRFSWEGMEVRKERAEQAPRSGEWEGSQPGYSHPLPPTGEDRTDPLASRSPLEQRSSPAPLLGCWAFSGALWPAEGWPPPEVHP